MSPSSSRSSSPDSEVPLSKTTKSKGSQKKSKKRATFADDEPKNEGEDQNWAYQPPAGSVTLENSENTGKFDWDALENDDDLEIWLVRVPDTIKTKNLENVSIEVPSEGSTSRIGKLSRKNADYDIWSVGDNTDVGGEELAGLSCLLPRQSKKDELYLAPRPIARRIVISATPASTTLASKPSPNPARPTYPKEVLKHAFTPYGAGLGISVDAPMEVEVDTGIVEISQSPVVPKTEKKSKNSKKRKGEATGDPPSPKKPKKAKH